MRRDRDQVAGVVADAAPLLGVRLARLSVVPSAVGAKQRDDVVVVGLAEPPDPVLARLDRGERRGREPLPLVGSLEPQVRREGREGLARKGPRPDRQLAGGVGLVDDVDEQGDGGVGPADHDEVPAAGEAR